jgi:hypothetical protein
MGNEQTEVERITRLETKLETELAAIKEALYDLKKTFLSREETYVTKSLIEAEFKLRDKEIENIQKELDGLKSEKQSSKNNLPVWIGIIPSVAAARVAIIALWK